MSEGEGCQNLPEVIYVTESLVSRTSSVPKSALRNKVKIQQLGS